jgi:hypothetical protein
MVDTISFSSVNFDLEVSIMSTTFTTATPGICVISLTGHRPDKLAGYDMTDDFYNRLRQRLIRIIERSLAQYPIVECHSGMALGADTVWAEAIIACREKYGRDRVPFVAEIPDYKQSSRWPYRSREKWSALMQYADRVNQYAPQNKGKSYAYILNQRNIGMISACDILIAVYNGDATGGTANGVRDGRRLDKWIVTIPPQSI